MKQWFKIPFYYILFVLIVDNCTELFLTFFSIDVYRENGINNIQYTFMHLIQHKTTATVQIKILS